MRDSIISKQAWLIGGILMTFLIAFAAVVGTSLRVNSIMNAYCEEHSAVRNGYNAYTWNKEYEIKNAYVDISSEAPVEKLMNGEIAIDEDNSKQAEVRILYEDADGNILEKTENYPSDFTATIGDKSCISIEYRTEVNINVLAGTVREKVTEETGSYSVMLSREQAEKIIKQYEKKAGRENER